MDTARSKIMLVDDNAANLTVGRQLLKPFYDVYTVSSAAAMFDVLHKIPTIDLILLDVDMPQMDGYEAIRRLKRLRRFAAIPVVFLTALRDEASELKGFDLGAVDYVSKPFSPPRLLKRIENQLLILRQRKIIQQHVENLERLVRKKTQEVFSLQSAMLDTMADLVDFRGRLSGGHSTRAQLYLKAMVDELRDDSLYMDEIAAWDMNFLLPAVQLHDVGKIAIPDSILNKPEKLTHEEFEVMKTHVAIGVDVVKRIMAKLPDHSFMEHMLRIVEAHHERWDGAGYPRGLKGEDIPLEGRLMAFADVYDALVSWRPYREAYTHEEAVEIMRNATGTHFDPSLMEVFLRVEGEFRQVMHGKIPSVD